MATIHGTIVGVTNVKRCDTAYGARNSARIAVNFGAYTGSSDSGDVASVGAAIAATIRNGKTITIRDGMCVGAGYDGTQNVYTGLITVSSDTITFNLASLDGTELTSSAATTSPVLIDICYDES